MFKKSQINTNDTILAFTLTELMVVVVLIGVIAAFAIPNYEKSMERSLENKAKLDLLAIMSAEEVYFAKYNNYWPPPPESASLYAVADINSNLGINITEISGPQGITYVCNNESGYYCRAWHGAKWVLGTKKDVYNGKPHCVVDPSNCPSCAGWASGGC